MRQWQVAMAFGLGVTACGGSGDAPSGTKSTDAVPPDIRDVRGTLGAPTPGTLDLGSSDAQRIITAPTPLTLQVFATDDVSATDALSVVALDDTGQPLADQTATLHNGLWEIATTATPGLSLHVAVDDEAKNRTTWPYAAVFPTREQALVRQWSLLVYDENGTVTARPLDTLTSDSWCQDDDAQGGGPRGGSWSVQADGRLTIETRHQMACDTKDFGTEWDSVEATRTAAFYVDATYFSDRPYVRQGGAASADITGTWTRQADLPQTATSTLTLLADGTFSESTEDAHQRAGTYEIQHNSDYTNDFGQLLILTTTRVDGADVAPTVGVHYWTLQNDQLLVDPFVEIP